MQRATIKKRLPGAFLLPSRHPHKTHSMKHLLYLMLLGCLIALTMRYPYLFELTLAAAFYATFACFFRENSHNSSSDKAENKKAP